LSATSFASFLLAPFSQRAPWTGGVQTHYTFAGGGVHFYQIQTDEVFGWGYNDYGQLGLGDNANRPTPQPVPLAPVLSGYPVSVCTGFYFSCVLDSNKDVACTGSDNYGQQGVGASRADANVLGVPTGVSSVVQLACGIQSVLVTTTTGSLMVWGYNGYEGPGQGWANTEWEAQVSRLLYSFCRIWNSPECTDCGEQRRGSGWRGIRAFVPPRRKPGRQVRGKGQLRAVGRRGGRFHPGHFLRSVWAPGYEHHIRGILALLRHARGR
jgi:hypothetical protein